MQTVSSRRLLPTSHGERSYNIELTTGWQDSPFELYMSGDGTDSVDITRFHLAINAQSPETLELACDAMQLTCTSAAKLIQDCRVNLAEGETETGALDVAETVERRIARLILADMNRRHNFSINSLYENTITNLMFLAIRHEPTESSVRMHEKVKGIVRKSVLV